MEVRPILYFFRSCLCSTSQSMKRLESKPELDRAFGTTFLTTQNWTRWVSSTDLKLLVDSGGIWRTGSRTSCGILSATHKNDLTGHQSGKLVNGH